MNLLQHQETMNSLDLQIWNNAVFDNLESEDTSTIKSSWYPENPICDLLDSASCKENQTPVFAENTVFSKLPAPIKPLHSNGDIENMQIKPIKAIPKKGIGEKSILKRSSEGSVLKKINMEIEETEKEIKRLSCRLEVLRLEKAEYNLKMIERRARVVPAKFMEQKQSDKSKEQRRGFSLGPSEIGAKSGRLGKQEITQLTPVQSNQSRRKSCFWKLQGIEEENGTKERRKSLNLSPKSRKPLGRAQIPRQAVTTVGLKKSLKKEDGVLQSIQPKNLFKDGEKSVPAKKTFKPGRVIASRYNQSNGNPTAISAIRKRSLPENDKGCDKKRASLIGKSRQSMEYGSSEISVSFIADMLPKIRTFGCTNETPRDSGPAKKVAELTGTKSFFSCDEVADMSVCQELSFEEK